MSLKTEEVMSAYTIVIKDLTADKDTWEPKIISAVIRTLEHRLLEISTIWADKLGAE
jgi:hypothetical protein